MSCSSPEVMGENLVHLMPAVEQLHPFSDFLPYSQASYQDLLSILEEQKISVTCTSWPVTRIITVCHINLDKCQNKQCMHSDYK